MPLHEQDSLTRLYLFSSTIVMLCIYIKFSNAKVITLSTEGIYLIFYSYMMKLWNVSRLHMMRLQSPLGI